jgi:hypothetical protein
MFAVGMLGVFVEEAMVRLVVEVYGSFLEAEFEGIAAFIADNLRYIYTAASIAEKPGVWSMQTAVRACEMLVRGAVEGVWALGVASEICRSASRE